MWQSFFFFSSFFALFYRKWHRWLDDELKEQIEKHFQLIIDDDKENFPDATFSNLNLIACSYSSRIHQTFIGKRLIKVLLKQFRFIQTIEVGVLY